jgi:glucosamine--fructose-6-phosphate aminotransferase (isomerizing)
MCGIFGMAISPDCNINQIEIAKIVKKLFILSEVRGSEASGIAIGGNDSVNIFRKTQPASQMIKTADYKKYLESNLKKENRSNGLSIIGHSRLVTNGLAAKDSNNQPIISSESVGVHNGIIVNDEALWLKHNEIRSETDNDSEVIFKLIDKFQLHKNLFESIASTYKEIVGEANIAFIPKSRRELCIATNVGSLYYAFLPQQLIFIFASEKFFLECLFKELNINNEKDYLIKQLKVNTGVIFDLIKFKLNLISFDKAFPKNSNILNPVKRVFINESLRNPYLIRCKKCILPITFPNISFDKKGICNYCNKERPILNKREIFEQRHKQLEYELKKYRKSDGSNDCIVALSGGRDSCYGLHYIKKELGLNPIAYTYDWAMVTTEARRNASKICASLGVEHIIRSADIVKKRRNIALNIRAWLKKPNLGMIPIFMAGDKQFFYYASQLSKQTGIPLVIFCGGNSFEVTNFKTGFCNVQDKSEGSMVGLSFWGKIKLLTFYAKNFILNPSYFNRSIFDTFFAFYSTYIKRGNFIYLYKYIEWDEDKINNTLKHYYDWEGSKDANSSWRAGDGTAAFYNYIYHTVAGFSEHDTFRSNQIRQGLITRDKALRMVDLENKPRYESIKEYTSLVGINFDEAMKIINNIPKLF